MQILACLALFQINFALGGWVDPDSPKRAQTTNALTTGDKRQFQLVFSDEFEQDGRDLADGNDPRWTSIHKNDYTNLALHFYHRDNVVTSNGVLNITTVEKVNTYKAFNESTKKFYADKKHIQSGMVQGWNKFCFTGGVIEFRAKLPGNPSIGGLWPALWMLGNLARATYIGSSDFMWPFSYNKCDPAGMKKQEINACKKLNHYGMQAYQGRGSPEIDILESMQGDMEESLPSTHIKKPYQSTSLQVAPGLVGDRPILGKRPRSGRWYTPIEYSKSNNSDLNPFFYGTTLVHTPKSYTYQADALSANLQLNESHYEHFHTYRVEWEPPDEEGKGGYLKWFTDKEFVFGVYGKTLEFMQTEIPSEPMYFIINTAVSSHWGFPQPCPEGCKCSCYECGNSDCYCGMPPGYCQNFPAAFEIDYVRVYQAVNETRHVLGCSPPDKPTDLWIKGHPERYMSEGDKRPLEPIARGGASCTRHKDCAGPKNGICSSAAICLCKDGFTGPKCLSHDAFYGDDVPYSGDRVVDMGLSKIFLPNSLLIFACIIVVGFLMSVTNNLRKKTSEHKYQPIGSAEKFGHYAKPGQGSTYQNPASSEYALPTQQKDVTYCVIDGRLVDQ